jgi:hypothetical protein
MIESNKQSFLKVRDKNGELWEVPESSLDSVIADGGIVEENNNISSSAPEQQTPENNFVKMIDPNGDQWEVPQSQVEQATNDGGKIVNDQSEEKYTGENPKASFAKNLVASGLGGLADIGTGLANLTSASGKPTYDPVTGEEFPAMQQLPSVTDMISESIDKATDNYTKDTGAKSKYAARFLGGLFGIGLTGKAIQAAGSAAKLGAVEGAGSFIANKLGATTPSASNISGSLAAGTTIGASEELGLPAYAEIPAVIGAFILGGGAGSVGQKALQPLFNKIPGMKEFIGKQNYSELAQKIDPDAIKDLMKTSLVDKEIDFLSQETFAKLPPEIRIKIKENPSLLNEEEINTVIDKGLSDFNSSIEKIEANNGFNLTLGEKTGSPKILAQEDYLANLPNVDKFDKAMKVRKEKIVKRIETIKSDLSKEDISSESLGNKIGKAVDKVYSDVKKLRSDNWDSKFGNVVNEKILPVSQYKDKLIEFAQLLPDTEGNITSIKASKIRWKSIGNEEKISPKRFNDILVGLNEDIRKFPDKTFSQKQMIELKQALENDLTKSIENAPTKEQASLIREAREGYKADSKLIDEIDDSILFSKIKEGNLEVPEKIASTLKSMPKSQLELTFNALKRSEKHHQIIPEIQKYYIDEALKSATKNGSDTFNPRIFLENLPKKPEFDIIFENEEIYKQIKDISVGLKRIAKYQPSRHNSKTAQRLEADAESLGKSVDVATDIAKGKFSKLFEKIGSVGKKNYNERVAEIMLSPQERDEVLKQVGKTQPNRNSALLFNTIKNSSEN